MMNGHSTEHSMTEHSITEHSIEEKGSVLTPYLPELAVWSLAVGTSVGWGSLVVTSNEYLTNAGPVGSVLGMAAGALIMFLIAGNYAYMANACPGAGGIYAYVKNVFGYDRAFLVSWFASLTYLAMLAANVTSVCLFVRYFFGDILRFGYLYTLFGYQVYTGEILLTFAVLILFGFICMKSKKLTAGLITGTVLVFCVGITVCFLAALAVGGRGAEVFDPAFIPEADAVRQVIKIAFITPWAFVGFESITHASEEYLFPVKKLHRVLFPAILVTTLLYVFVLLLSVTAYPDSYSSWLEYIRDLDNLSGIEGLPAFYAVYSCLGNTGVFLLMISLLGLVFSSLIGNMAALSRLLCAVSRDSIIPDKYSRTNGKGIPENTVRLILILSAPVPFFGRTAVGWVVDVTVISAILMYGFVSAAAMRQSRRDGDRRTVLSGALGLGLMIVFGIYTVAQSFAGGGGIARESQLILIIWSILGLYYFRLVMTMDHGRRFGKNITVWIVLVAFIFVLTMMWICEECAGVTAENLLGVRNYYSPGGEITRIADDPAMLPYLASMMKMIVGAAAGVIIIFIVSLGAMLSNWAYVRKCEEEAKNELGAVKEVAYKDPLTGAKSKHVYLLEEQGFDTQIREGRVKEFAVVVCDVNGLKIINDTQGHKAGDEYIRQAFFMICDIFQHSPVFRIGGDEFATILTGRDFAIRKELMQVLHDRSVEHIGGGGVVVSGGLSDYRPGEDLVFHDVFQRADSLMYEEKQLLKGMGSTTRDDAGDASR